MTQNKQDVKIVPTKLTYKEFPHKSIIYKNDGTEFIGDNCDGNVYYDIALEGNVCCKCDMNTSLK